MAEAVHGAQQALGIGVSRRSKQIFHTPFLDDLPRVHNDRPIAKLGDYAQIMGDEDYREAVLIFETAQHVKDLCLHRDIERRGRLIRDKQFGRPGKGGRNHHSLTHPSREFVWI
jgi:hypothetical protein